MTLTEFLTARLNEKAAAANEIHRPRDCGSVDRDGEFSSDPVYCSCDYPARVLREVEAGRKILAAYETVLGECATLLRDQRPRKYGEHDGLREAVAHLASVYADHPDYDEAWRPPGALKG
jgi:hypothetical protein